MKSGRIIFIGIATAFVAGTYLFAGIIKVWAPDRFLLDIQGFQLAPYPLEWLVALALPWLEILCALSLALRRFTSGAALILSVLSGFFIFALLWARTKGIDLECGCFGDWMVFPNLATHIAYNALLVVASVGLLIERLCTPDRQ